MVVKKGVSIYAASGTEENPHRVEDAIKWARNNSLTVEDVAIRSNSDCVYIITKKDISL